MIKFKNRAVESAIQCELVKWLSQEYGDIEYYYNKNEGMKAKAVAMLDKRMGLIAGRVDMDLVKTVGELAYFLHLEIKTLEGGLNPNQIKYHAAFNPTKNRIIKVAYGFEECKKTIIEWIEEINNLTAQQQGK